jgi:DNA-binding beta-propeller fold protein YncE
MPDKSQSSLPDTSVRLEGWDSIAHHLGVHKRTARAWFDERGLPVHQLFGKGGRVYAIAVELDAWRVRSDATAAASNPPTEVAGPIPNRRRVWVAIAAALVLLAALSVSLYRRPDAPRRTPARLLAKLSSEAGRLKSIPLSGEPCYAVITPDGARIVVATCGGGGAVTIIATSSGGVIARMTVGREPTALALDDGGNTLYVGDAWSGIRIVDVVRAKVVGEIPLEGPVMDLALSRDGTLYVARRERGLVAIRISDRRITAIPVNGMAMFLALGPDGSRLFVSYQGGGPGGRIAHDAIDVYDTKSGAFVANISGLPRVGGPLEVSRNGLLVAAGEDGCWSASYKDYSADCPVYPGSVFSVIRASDSKVLATRGFPDGPSSWAGIFPDGSRVALGAGMLRVFDTADFEVREQFALPGVVGLLFAADGKKAWAVRQGPPLLSVIDTDEAGCAPAPGSLVGWWTGDGTEHDARAINDGSWQGNAGYAPGMVGQAFRMEGASFVSLGGLATLLTESPDFTAMAWVKFAAGGADETVLQRLGPGGFRLSRDKAGRVSFVVVEPGGMTAVARAENPVADDRWVHLAAIRSPGSVSLVLDGVVVAVAQLSGAGWRTLSVGEVRVGPVRGLVDEVQWFNRALPQQEVAAVAAAGGAGVCGE